MIRRFTHSEVEYPCRTCGRVYHSKGGLKQHQLRSCGKPKEFKCWYCLQKFCFETNMNKHVKAVHKKKKTYKMSTMRFPCTNCDQVYRSKSGLKHHLNSKCGKELNFKCIYCLKMFHSNASLKKHTKDFHPRLK